MSGFAEFFRRTHPDLIGYARKLVSDRNQAEDVVADGELVLLRRWGVLKSWLDEPHGADRVRRYAFGVVRYVAFDVRRKVSRSFSVEGSELEWYVPGVSDGTDVRALEMDILRGISQLSATQQNVVSLVMDGWSYDEISDHLGLAPAVVRTYLARARRRLRELLGFAAVGMGVIAASVGLNHADIAAPSSAEGWPALSQVESS